MSIYHSTKVLPYVYRLDNPNTGEFYIGFRSANKVPCNEDIGIKYFTSSKYVKYRFCDFKISIIAEFTNKDDAFYFEQQLIKESFHSPLILNKRYYENGTAKMFSCGGSANGMFGKTHTKEVKDAQRVRMLGKNKGRSYEEIYGIEKANQLKLTRKLSTTGKDNSGSKNPRALKILAISPTKEEYTIIGGIDIFCKEHALGISHVRDNYLHNKTHYLGWSFTIIN